MAALVVTAGCAKQPATTESGHGATAVPAAMTPVQRGEHLVKTMGCNDCHTPWKLGANGPEPDMTKFLSGHPAEFQMPPPPDLSGQPWQWVGAATMTAFAGPWGVSYAPNLTPDVTGTASWTEAQFIEVIRSGKVLGGARPIMPPMPWPNIAQLTDDDLKAMYAYLRTIPPIANLVPSYQPPAGAGS